MHLGATSAIADLNNDGLKDLVVGGYSTNGLQSQWYKYNNIYFASSPDSIPNPVSRRLLGPFITSFGLACFDVNGDAIADLLWTTGDSRDDYINVHYGGTSFDTIPNLRLKDPGVANFGFTIVNGGDMNGDGYNDIAVGCPDAAITSGFVFVFAGGPRIDGTFDAAVGQSTGSFFGSSIASVGDVSGDGLSDIIVAAPHYPEFCPIECEKGYWGIFLGDSAIGVTGVQGKPTTPSIFRLYQCYPNPFNPQTTIEYQLSQAAFINLSICNILGQRVVTLVNEYQQPGIHKSIFDAANLPSGSYFYKLVASTKNGTVYADTKKLTFIK